MRNKKKVFLAGDIGGTKTELALFQKKGAGIYCVERKRFLNSLYKSFEAVIGDFLKGVGNGFDIEGAALGVAAPVENNRARLTNLGWRADGNKIGKRFSFKCVLLNDLEATALGIGELKKKDFFCLQKGRRRKGSAIIIAPGTGLGEAALLNLGEEVFPMASEGGHVDFAPRTRIEAELLFHLSAKYGRVSYERVVSGPGIKEIYDFLARGKKIPERIKKSLLAEDPSKVIANEAEKKDGDKTCRKALSLFVSILGAEAGNMALTYLAKGGVYLAGGIPPKIIKALKRKEFLESFRDKGRFKEYLSSIPVYVVLNDKAALLGAMRRAAGIG
ncbi:MAG: glucokinase [Thermodesulfobacteriota bacterium]